MLHKFFHFASQTADLQAQQKAKSFMAMESLSKWSRKQAAHRHMWKKGGFYAATLMSYS